MGEVAYSGEGNESQAVRHDADPREVAAAEAIRTRFDCSGTVWGTYVRADGKPTCHGLPFANGAPDVLSCGVRIEYKTGPGVYEIVPPGDKYAPDEVNEDFLLKLGGGRCYRISLRKGGQTIPHSYLPFDLSGRCERIPFPHEREGREEREGRSSSTKAPSPPIAQSAQDVLALGADPWAAMIGASVAQMAPEHRLMFALLNRDAQRAEMWATKSVEHMTHFFGQMTGVMREAARGGGGSSEVATMLRAQVESAARIAEQASRDAKDAQQRLHEKELAEARASGTNAPSPVVPLVVGAGERVLTKAVEHLITTAGADAARSVVEGVGAAAATAAAAAA